MEKSIDGKPLYPRMNPAGPGSQTDQFSDQDDLSDMSKLSIDNQQHEYVPEQQASAQQQAGAVNSRITQYGAFPHSEGGNNRQGGQHGLLSAAGPNNLGTTSQAGDMAVGRLMNKWAAVDEDDIRIGVRNTRALLTPAY